ncbi:hypothetical protein HPULCUR_003435 [Helicostylum pulchrum]|uniref:Uncharacterized protein n=1 Tax=Helicostylum pulchrum TaxID=562976 RepID=A0ABP9XVG2_9FUNG
MMVPLEQRSNKIASALENLSLAPDYLVEYAKHKAFVWDNVTSLATYPIACLNQHMALKPTSRIHRDFFSCMTAMDALYEMSLVSKPAGVNISKMHLSVRNNVVRGTYERLLRPGRRCLLLVEVFDSFSALAILGPYMLTNMENLCSVPFNKFVAHLKRESRRECPVVMNIRHTLVDPRLVYFYGRDFPSQLKLYLSKNAL